MAAAGGGAAGQRAAPAAAAAARPHPLRRQRRQLIAADAAQAAHGGWALLRQRAAPPRCPLTSCRCACSRASRAVCREAAGHPLGLMWVSAVHVGCSEFAVALAVALAAALLRTSPTAAVVLCSGEPALLDSETICAADVGCLRLRNCAARAGWLLCEQAAGCASAGADGRRCCCAACGDRWTCLLPVC